MRPFHEYMIEYRKQLEKGDIQEAYKGLMRYFGDLRSHFKREFPEYETGGIYYGYMDMTYFSFIPKSLKQRKLKVAIVFIHEAFRFEVWLVGYNRAIQKQYWALFTETAWKKYHVETPAKGVDAILDHVLINDPDFSDLDSLTKQIERGTLKFTKDVENFLSKN